MNMVYMKQFNRTVALLALFMSCAAFAQKYPDGIIDKTIAVVGNEMIMISDIEDEIQMRRAGGYAADRNARCEILEQMLSAKLFLMQSRIDSLTVNNDMVNGELNQRIDDLRTRLGGDEQLEAYFKKPLYKLRKEWKQAIEEMSLTQQMQQKIASSIPEMTP